MLVLIVHRVDSNVHARPPSSPITDHTSEAGYDGKTVSIVVILLIM